jgi:hypothetical protein
MQTLLDYTKVSHAFYTDALCFAGHIIVKFREKIWFFSEKWHRFGVFSVRSKIRFGS